MLGARLVHHASPGGPCAGIVIEVEAYKGDAASHFVTRRHAGSVMGSSHGRLYIYRIYGVHWCLNVTTDAHGPGAVLLRALEPVEGIDLMRARRGRERIEDLCGGPARLVQALGVDPALDGRPFDEGFSLHLPRVAPEIAAAPRVGITKAMDLPWRFMVRGSRFVSRPIPPQARAPRQPKG